LNPHSVFEPLRPYIGVILSGLPTTLLLTFGGFGIGLLIGPLLAFLEVYGPNLGITYSNHYRGDYQRDTSSCYLIPSVLWVPLYRYSAFPVISAIIAIGIRSFAYQSQIIRSAILSIPRGQWEAALSLGMTKLQAILCRYLLDQRYPR